MYFVLVKFMFAKLVQIVLAISDLRLALAVTMSRRKMANHKPTQNIKMVVTYSIYIQIGHIIYHWKAKNMKFLNSMTAAYGRSTVYSLFLVE